MRLWYGVIPIGWSYWCISTVNSQSVEILEECHDLESYYREMSRVLRKGGASIINFPHRLIPFDSHSRLWFVHIFPKQLRDIMYQMAGRDHKHDQRQLNYKTVRFHRRIAKKYFESIFDKTTDRLSAFNEKDLYRYEGNTFLRGVADKIIKNKKISPFIMPFFRMISNVDLCLVK